MNEFVTWPPDLFAFTSYVFSHTGAYQMVVSPPIGKKWPPTASDLERLIDDDDYKKNLDRWLRDLVVESRGKRKEEMKWALDTKLWAEFRRGQRFDRTFIDRFHTIPSIVSDIAKNARKEISLLKEPEEPNWNNFVGKLGKKWNENLTPLWDDEFQLINHAAEKEEGNVIELLVENKGDSLSSEEYTKRYMDSPGKGIRSSLILGLLLKYTPPLVLVIWAKLYCGIAYSQDQRPLHLSDLLCNDDQPNQNLAGLWDLFLSLITLHATVDECCSTWGTQSEKKETNVAKWWAERLLYDKGSLSTINSERARILPKRHNPNVGITLRSLSSSLAFHRSSVEVVWRRTRNAPIEEKLNKFITEAARKDLKGARKNADEVTNNCKTKNADETIVSILLLPFPLEVRARDFGVDIEAMKVVKMDETNYGFFKYEPSEEPPNQRIIDLIKQAGNELGKDSEVDLVVFPEGALSKSGYGNLLKDLEGSEYRPAIVISGIRESREDIWAERTWNALSIQKLEEDIESLLKEARDRECLHEVATHLREWREIKTKLIKQYAKTLKIGPKTPVIAIEKILMEEKDKANEANQSHAGDDEILKLKKWKQRLETWEGLKRDWHNQMVKNEIAKEEVHFGRNAIYCNYFDGHRKTYLSAHKRHRQKHRQYKHHRWQLNGYQIGTYGLSSILSVNRRWWESMKVPRRRVSFLNVGNGLTIAHLVCEDLARQDPIADLIRHAGPSLVVSLLMDGPQLKTRWPARYASILSDDPGSSVITLTSWGMVRRYSSPHGLMSNVIALWSESGGGQIREIELAGGAQAVLLTLKLASKRERTADCRLEEAATTLLQLVDVIQIYGNMNTSAKSATHPGLDRSTDGHFA